MVTKVVGNPFTISHEEVFEGLNQELVASERFRNAKIERNRGELRELRRESMI